MKRTVSSLRPGGADSASISVTNPYLYPSCASERTVSRVSMEAAMSGKLGQVRAGSANAPAAGTKAIGEIMSSSEIADSASPTARLIAPQCGRVGQ